MSRSPNETTHVIADPADSVLLSLARAVAGSSAFGNATWPKLDLSDPKQREFGDYELLDEIGRGGMGVVYRARQLSLDRDVAIKFIADWFADPTAVARFLAEARAAARLMHPNIVPVHEVGSVDGMHYFSMPLIRGHSLATLLDRRTFSPADAIALLLKLCEAIDYAHRLGLLHLDLKPANVLIDAREEPLIADFGLARHMDEKGGVDAQEVSGTPTFMAPEQILIKQYRLTPATDIYALGAILYRCLTGVSPHGEGSPDDVIRRAAAGRIRPLRELKPSIPRDLDAICMKCLELQPSDRYASAAQLADDLRRARDGLPVSVRKPSLPERLRRWYAREPKFALALASLFLLAVVGCTALALMYGRAEATLVATEWQFHQFGKFIANNKHLTAYNSQYATSDSNAEKWRVPIADCQMSGVLCGGALMDPGSSVYGENVGDAEINLEMLRLLLPQDSRRVTFLDQTSWYLNSPMVAWLRADIYNLEPSVQWDKSLDERAASALQLAEKSNDTNDLLFALLLYRWSISDTWSRSEYDRVFNPRTNENAKVDELFNRALSRADQPWQLRALTLLPGNIGRSGESTESRMAASLAARARYRERDPNNADALAIQYQGSGAHWLNEETDRLIVSMSQTSRLENHVPEFIDAARAYANRLMPALPERLRMTPDQFALRVLDGFFQSNVALPGDYCAKSFQERASPSIDDACRAIFAKVTPETRPSWWTESNAAMVTLQTTNDPSTRAQALKRYRNARWIYTVWMQLPPDSRFDDPAQVQVIRDRGEYAYMQSVVAKAGLPLEAPDEFVTPEPLPWARRNNATAGTGR